MNKAVFNLPTRADDRLKKITFAELALGIKEKFGDGELGMTLLVQRTRLAPGFSQLVWISELGA